MSPLGFKRLTVKAKQSFSGLKPLCEGHDVSVDTCHSSPSSDKENVTPDPEDFGAYRTDTNSTVSEARESQSRCKRLIGSLRSISSLRSVRSPPSTEKPKQHEECAVEPESPHTPLRPPRVRPSLALNFEQSPPDQPMFDMQQRRRSISSSLVAHHPSPLSIPIPAKQEDLLSASAAQQHGIPSGTIPDPPNPLQLALDRDNIQCLIAPDASLSQLRTEAVARPCPTPLSGTNTEFTADDLAGDPSSSKGTGASLPEVTSRSGIPVTDSADDTDLGDVIGEAQQLAGMAALSNSFTRTTGNRGVMAIAALDEVEKARLHGNRIHQGDSSNLCYSPIDIDHIIFEDHATLNTIDEQPAHEAYVIAQAQTQMDLQKQAHMWAESSLQQHTVDITNARPANNEWGTHGSLYDGTGYGDECSSTSPRPSTSSTAPKPSIKGADNTTYTGDHLAQESETMARDHETLEEVIRAYAAFEEQCAAGLSEEMLGDIVADVEMAERMTNYSLGA